MNSGVVFMKTAKKVDIIPVDKKIRCMNDLMKNSVAFAKLSFDLEERREQSLISQSNSMLTAFSLYSAALLMAIPILIVHSPVPDHQILSCALLVFIPIVASLFLTLLAQWRYRYQTMQTGDVFRLEIENNLNAYKYQYQYDYQMIQQLTIVQNSKIKINNKRLRFIQAAMVLFLISCGILVSFGILFYILYA